MANIWLSAAAVSGFLSVSIGAFGAHGLKTILDPYGRDIFETAVQYQMFHTLGLLAVGMLQATYPKQRFQLAGWGFLIGMVLFCGSLYIMAVSGIKWLGAVTPLGGTAFLLGWGVLAFRVLRLNRSG
jgi:uncharacterized membrane protein YgdD (TMEM256/DUF423 family)